MNRETALSRNIRLAVNKTGRARLLDNEVGYAAAERVRYGLGVGSPDLVGCLRGSARLFCLEVKTPTGRPTAEQLAWLRAARNMGAFATIVRSVEDALAALERAEGGASE